MQNLTKINAKHTIKVEDKNHYDWHKGIERYGFWAIVIKDEYWLKEFHLARKYISTLVLPNYKRRPHITLSACGLIDSSHFSNDKLQAQVEVLRKQRFKAFSIKLNNLDSFESAPFLSVSKNASLSKIRDTLENVHQDNPALEYTPHLTLGFYDDRYDTTLIRQYLSSYSQSKVSPLRVDRIAFCHYQTNRIQEDFFIEFELPLSS